MRQWWAFRRVRPIARARLKWGDQLAAWILSLNTET